MTEAQRESLCTLIRQAGAHAQALRDAGLQVDKKARQDFVSPADLAVEHEKKKTAPGLGGAGGSRGRTRD